MTHNEIVFKRGISNLPAVHGPAVDEGNVSIGEQNYQSVFFFISLVCGLSSQAIYCMLSHTVITCSMSY